MKLREITVTRAEFESNLMPIVYEVWAENVCIYVGYSAHGFARVFLSQNAGDNHVNRVIAFRRATEIRMSFYDGREEAGAEEERLIHERHPRYNRQCVICDKKGLLPQIRAVIISIDDEITEYRDDMRYQGFSKIGEEVYAADERVT